ncbi:MAG TPA: CarD family transcriptional regulator, partial [Gemmatimonadaceae bacterium]|nr:CarD family transcriptional regulator [Gemmatimonadaceae bacterium]
MALPPLLDAVERLGAFARLLNTLPRPGERRTVGGLAGSSDAALVAALARRLPGRFFAVVTDALPEAERWLADLESLIEDAPVVLYPPREGFGEAEPHAEVAGERVETLERINRGGARILLTTARAVLERTQLARAVQTARLDLRKGDVRRLEELAAHLETIGFDRVPMVEDVAQFSVRGGIFDIYSFGMAEPVRLEFWGDEVVDLRHFDLVSQRSTREADVAVVLPVDGAVSDEGGEFERVTLAELWPPDTVVVYPAGVHLEPELRRTWDEAQHHIELARRRGEDAPPRDELYQPPEAASALLARFGVVDLVRAARGDATAASRRAGAAASAAAGAVGASAAALAAIRGAPPETRDVADAPESRHRSTAERGESLPAAEVVFPTRPPELIDRDIKRLRQILRDGIPTLILCDNSGQSERLEELLGGDDGGGGGRSSRGGGRNGGSGIPPNVTLAIGVLDGGFVIPPIAAAPVQPGGALIDQGPTGLRILTDHEIFRRERRIRRARRYGTGIALETITALKAGDYVVHLEHGIGIYRGIQKIFVGESTVEVAVIEYEGGDRLNVPLYRIDQIERYRAASDVGATRPGAGGADAAPPPRLHRLGGKRWAQQRDKTRAAIQEMTVELLDLYARRKVATRPPHLADSAWQRQLESSFLFEDTPDQRKATTDVKRDMENARPMDRLLVGDVGYGKTEIAVRAAFKAVQSGRQVAVLVPTTILAEQHARTFGDRFADFPVRVETMSRFQSAKEQG